MIRKFAIAACLFFSACVQAEIIETAQIEDIRQYVIDDALILIDIDDTLIENPFTLGTPPWRNWVKSRLADYKTSFVLYDALTLKIAQKVPYKTMEPTTTQLIADLQNEDHAVFAFTARGRTQWYTTDIEGVDIFTHEQLKGVGIDFKKTNVPAGLQALEPTYFYDGIIFAQHIKKGDLLKHLFKDLNYKPSVIIFVDDKLDQVKSVEAVVEKAGIPFIGFWYKRSEQEHANFNPLVADIQLELLLENGGFLNDEDAEWLAQDKTDVNPTVYLKQILDQNNLQTLEPKIIEN